MTTTTLAQLQSNGGQPVTMPQDVAASFGTIKGFEALQRMGHLFAQSDLVPAQFRGNLPNCTIAIDMAMRLGSNPLLVMQNLYVIQGRPAWSAQFLIATFNASGKYSSIRYEFTGTPGSDDWGCRAVATELKTGDKLEGPVISIKLAKANGWFGKPGSKWQTMPEQMLRYRAAAWFIRTIAPEIALGLSTVEEVKETIELEAQENGSYAAPEPKNPMDKVAAHVDAAPARKRARKAKAEEAPAPAPEVVETVEDAQEAPAEDAAPAQPVQEDAPQAPQSLDDMDLPELVGVFNAECKRRGVPGACLVTCYQRTVKNVEPEEAKAAMAHGQVFETILRRWQAQPDAYPEADW